MKLIGIIEIIKIKTKISSFKILILLMFISFKLRPPKKIKINITKGIIKTIQ